MNLKKCYDLIAKEWPKLGFEITSLTRDKLEMRCEISAEKYFDDDVLFRVIVYDSGTTHVIATFDELEKTFENYDLINNFNDNTSWFKAYITETKSGKLFLELHYASIDAANEKAIEHIVTHVLSELISDGTMEYLKPLVERTHSD